MLCSPLLAPGGQQAVEHRERAVHAGRDEDVGDAIGVIHRAPLIRAGHPVHGLGFGPAVEVSGWHIEGVADGGQIRHGRARQATLNLGQEAHRTLDFSRQLGEGELLVLTQVVDQRSQGGEFFLLAHEIYVE
jgi:hypothetical protein